MGIAESAWIVLGNAFRCRGVPAVHQPALAALLRGFPAAGPAAEAFEIPVAPQDDVPLIEYRLINEAIARARGRWVLHAGAVAGPRGTCLILGESGAGKTSLTLWLWSSGLELVTDDLCPVRHGDLAVERFPRALHMDCEYSPRLLKRIPPRPPSYPADYYPFPEAPEGEPPPVSDLLVLERGAEGEEPRLSPLSQAEAAHHLLGAVIKSPAFDYGQALTGMIGLASRCRGRKLRSSSPEEAGAAALAALGQAL
ncbi:MAG: hypothetical protein ACJ76N_04500 [Thermoanaerobaculia bacterium]